MIGDGMNGYNPRYVLDAANPDEVSQLLRDLARAAAFRGEVPLPADAGDLLLSLAQEEEDATSENPVQQAVDDGIREAAQAIAETQVAVQSLNKGLAFLKEQLKDEFNYRTRDDDRSTVLIELNPDSPGGSYIAIANDGTLMSGYEETEYDAWDDADVAKVMGTVTSEAMIQAARKAARNKPGMF